jgi:hypothetical protein
VVSPPMRRSVRSNIGITGLSAVVCLRQFQIIRARLISRSCYVGADAGADADDLDESPHIRIILL